MQSSKRTAQLRQSKLSKTDPKMQSKRTATASTSKAVGKL